MFRRPSFRVILIALAILGLAGLGFLFAPGGPTLAQARLELGGALVSGVVLSGAFLVAERRLEAEDRKHEELTAERQTRAQYQLALGMADDLRGKTLAGLDLWGLTLTLKDLTGANLAWANLGGANLRSANLTRANLTRANLTGAKWRPENPPTWPRGFDPPENAWDPETDG